MKGIKVEVDYSNGCYNVTGIYEEEMIPMRKPIRGFDRDCIYKAGYSRGIIQHRKNQIKQILEKIQNENTNVKYSEKLIKNVDTLMYKALEDWDNINGTTYALDYLKAITQVFEKRTIKDMHKGTYKTASQSLRKKSLEDAGIDISYRIILAKANESLNIFDKMKGILIARKQKKSIGAKVIGPFTPNRNKSRIINDETYERNNTEKEKGNEIQEADEVKKIEETDTNKEKNNVSNDKKKINTKEKANSQKKKKRNRNKNKENKRKIGYVSPKKEKFKNKRKKITTYERYLKAKKAEEEKRARAREGMAKKRLEREKLEAEKINENVKHWTRKITPEESIKQKNYQPNHKIKKRVIRGASILLASGFVFLGIQSINHNQSSAEKDINKTTMSYQIKPNTMKSTKESTSMTYYDIKETETKNEPTSSENIFKAESETRNTQKSVVREINKEKENEEQSIANGTIREKTDAEKLEMFTNMALEKYRNTLIIGKKPEISDILDNITYSENPDGSGKIGSFSKYSDYIIGHINIVTNSGFETIKAEGRSLQDILAEYPDYITYNIHFLNRNTGGGLGFVTQSQLEMLLIQNKVKPIVDSRFPNQELGEYSL